MTTLLDDIRLALRQICRDIGLDETAATVIPLVVLGLALNIAALGTAKFLRISGKRDQSHAVMRNAALRSATHTELKAIRIVMHSTIQKMNNRRSGCQLRQWVKNTQKPRKYHVEGVIVLGSPAPGQQCDLKLVGTPGQSRMIAFVQC